MIIRRCSISNSTSQRSQSQKMSENEQCNSNSHFSTCCSNASSENDEIDDPFILLLLMISSLSYLQLLMVQKFRKQLGISFLLLQMTYDISMKKMKQSNKIRYRLTTNAWCCLNSNSWVKNKWDCLLEHETGHYLIGCLCARDFKTRVDKSKFTKNYTLESAQIFQDTFQEYLTLEKKYDEETNHSQNISRQKEWNEFIIKELIIIINIFTNENRLFWKQLMYSFLNSQNNSQKQYQQQDKINFILYYIIINHQQALKNQFIFNFYFTNDIQNIRSQNQGFEDNLKNNNNLLFDYTITFVYTICLNKYINKIYNNII